jgi:uncharacterized protein YbjT (DUF2867 family)
LSLLWVKTVKRSNGRTFNPVFLSSIALLGATGLVGRNCLEQLAADRAFDRIVVVARRRFGEATAPRVEGHLIDFDQLEAHADIFAVDQVICALGTTIKVAGSKARFRAVDYDIPLTAARMAMRKGARHFLLVSSIGADASSRFFYLRVKGELEDALRTLGFRSVTIVRPSVLLGDRGEFRFGEEVAKRFGSLVPGKWRPVQARDVAAALIRSAKEDVPGLHILESDEIAPFARALS